MDPVDRNSLPTLFFVVVAVLALSATGATINEMVGGPSGGDISVELNESDTGDQFNQSQGDQENETAPSGNTRGSISLRYCIAFLTRPSAILATIGGLALLLYGVYYRFNASTTFLIGSGVIPVVFGAYFFLTNCASTVGPNQGSSNGVAMPGAGAGIEAPGIPPAILGGGLVVVLGLSAVLLYAVTGDDEEFQPIDDEEEFEAADQSDFAEAAGKAADRIEEANVAVDNAVYRAWYQMTQLLDIPDPETSSPLDFAERAIEFGLAEDDVMELTELFNAVRYGHMDPATREERAVEILRHIESEYENTIEESDSSTGGDER